jgi:elongation factor P
MANSTAITFFLASPPPMSYNRLRYIHGTRGNFMIDVNELRKGVCFETDGNIFKVIEYSFNKPGRGNATIRIKARNLRTGTTLEKTFQSGDRIQDIHLEGRTMQYMYNDGDLYFFMDTQTFEQPGIHKNILGEYVGYLKPGIEAKIVYYQEEPIDVELPTSVDLLVTHSEMAVRGDTATGVTKKVTVESGAQVDVPYFINEGDTIRVDTRTGKYVTRV